MPLKSKRARKKYRKGYWKKYYSDPVRRERHLLAVRKSEKRRRQLIKTWINEHKISLGCKICGFREHASALDFDHRNPSEKSFTVASFSSKGWSLEAIKREVTKCDVLCANHHRMRHSGVLEESGRPQLSV